MGLFYVRSPSTHSRSFRQLISCLEQLGILVGPATAPAIAGILTEYVKPYGFGWRAMQYLLMSLGFSAFALVLFFFPETAHAKGIDVVRQERLQERAEKKGMEVELLEKEEEQRRAEMRWLRRQWDGLVWVWLNPLAPLRLLLHPNIAAMVRLCPLPELFDFVLIFASLAESEFELHLVRPLFLVYLPNTDLSLRTVQNVDLQ